MWHELIRINEGTFRLGRQFEDEYYSILDGKREIISSHKVIRWFKNGYLLAKAEQHFERESRDGVDLSYTDFIYTVLDADFKEIHSIRVGNYSRQPTFLDFIQGYLILSHGSQFGAISETGETLIPFNFSEKEAEHRLMLIRPLEQSSTKNIARNEGTKIIYKSRLSSIQDTAHTKKFIDELNSLHSTEEKLYHLLLRRYSYAMRERFDDKYRNELLPYDNSDFYLCKLDITAIVTKIMRLTQQTEPSISYWDKYNLSHSNKKLIVDLQNYFGKQDENSVNKRLNEMELLTDILKIEKINADKFKAVCQSSIPKIDSLDNAKMTYSDYLQLIVAL